MSGTREPKKCVCMRVTRGEYEVFTIDGLSAVSVHRMVMFYLTQTLLVNLSYVAVHFVLSCVVMFMSCLLGLVRPEVVPRRSCADYCLCYLVHSACSGNIDVLVILLIVDFVTHNCWLTCLFGQTMHGVIYCTQSDPGACCGGLRSLRRDAESPMLGSSLRQTSGLCEGVPPSRLALIS